MPTRTRHLSRRWSRMLAADGTFTDLTPTNDEAQANDINDDGTIVGELKTASAEHRAFIRPAGGPVQELGTLGGTFSSANAMNSSGLIAGYSLNGSNRGRAMSYDPATSTMTDLGTLGGDYSEANGVNDAGFIVGGSRITSRSTRTLSSSTRPPTSWPTWAPSAVTSPMRTTSTTLARSSARRRWRAATTTGSCTTSAPTP